MRLNLRLLLPIVLVIGLIGGALGTGWFLRVRSRAARAENRGDAFRAQGRAEEAVAQYLAALKHARSAARRQDLALKLADVYEAWPPESPEQAFENAHMALYMLTQVRMMDPANRDVNNKLLDYAFEMARLPNVPQAWQALVAQADHVLEKDPENLLATRYRGIAKVQLMGIATLGSEDQLLAKEDLRTLIRQQPEVPENHYYLAGWYLQRAALLARQGRPTEARENGRSARRVMGEFMAGAPPTFAAQAYQLTIFMACDASWADPGDADQTRAVMDALIEVLPTQTLDTVTVATVGHLLEAFRRGQLARYADEPGDIIAHLEQYLEAACKEAPQVEACFLLGQVREAMSDPDGALDAYVAIRDSVPPRPGLHAAKTDWLYRSLVRGRIARLRVELWDQARGTAAAQDLLAMARKAYERWPEPAEGNVDAAPGRPMIAAWLAIGDERDRDAVNLIADFTPLPADLALKNRLHGEALVRLGETGSAIRALRAAMRAARAGSRESALAGGKLVDVLLAIGRLDEADAVSLALLEASADFPAALLARARVLREKARRTRDQNGAAEESGRLLADALALVTKPPATRDLACRLETVALHTLAGKPDAAVACAQEALAIAPHDPAANRQLVLALNAATGYEAATAHAAKVVSQYPARPAAAEIRRILDQQERPLALLADLVGLTLVADEANHLALLYLLLMQHDQQRQARHWLDLATQRFPAAPTVLKILAGQAIENRNWDTFDRLLDNAKNNGGDPLMDAYYRGVAAVSRDRSFQGVDYLQKVVLDWPDFSDGWYQLGNAQWRAGNNDAARTSLQQALKIKADHPRALQLLHTVYDRQGNHADALGLLGTAVRFSPRDREVFSRYLNYAALYGHATDVLDIRRMIAERMPTDEANRRDLARLIEKRGDNAQAEMMLDRLLQNGADKQANALALADFLGRGGRLAEGLKALATQPHDPDDPSVIHLAQARFLRRHGALEESLKTYREAVELAAQPPHGVVVETADLLRSMGRTQEAMVLYQAAWKQSRATAVGQTAVLAALAEGELKIAAELLADLETVAGEPLEVRILQGKLAAARGLTDQAMRAFDEAAKNAPEDPRPLYHRAVTFRHSQDETIQKRVLIDLLKLQRDHPYLAGPREMLGDWYLRRGEFEEAVQTIHGLVEAFPKEFRYREQLIRLHVGRDQLPSAEHELNACREDFAADHRLWVLGAEYARRRGQPFQALRHAMRAWSLDRREITLVTYCDSLLNAGFPAAAERVLASPQAVPLQDSPGVSVMRGRLALEKGDQDGMRKHMAQAFVVAGNRPGQEPSVARQMADVLTAEDLWQVWRRLEHSHPAAAAAAAIGRQLYHRGDYARAVTVLNAATGPQGALGDPGFKPDVFLAHSYVGLKQYEQARDVYERLLAEDPHDVMAMNNYADLLARHLGQTKRATTLAKQAVKAAESLGTGQAFYLDSLGYAQMADGETGLAVDTFAAALRLVDLPVAHLHMAEALFRQGTPDFAFAELGRAEDAAIRRGDAKAYESILAFRKDTGQGVGPTHLRTLANLYLAAGHWQLVGPLVAELKTVPNWDPANIDLIERYLRKSHGQEDAVDALAALQNTPGLLTSVKDWLALARAWDNLGEAEPAREAFRQAVAKEKPTEALASLAFASWLLQQQEYQAAATLLVSARDRTGSAEAWRGLINAYLCLGDLDTAQREIQAFMAEDKGDANMRLLEARLAGARGKTQLAVANLDVAAMMDRGDAKTFLARATFHLTQDPMDPFGFAKADLQYVLNLDPACAEAVTKLAELLARQGATPEAARQLESFLTAQVSGWEPMLQLGELYVGLAEFGKLGDLLAEAQGFIPESAALLRLQARVALAAGDTTGGVKALRQAFAESESESDLQQLMQALLEADLLAELAQQEQASRALVQQSSGLSAIAAQGALRAGRTQQAQDLFERAGVAADGKRKPLEAVGAALARSTNPATVRGLFKRWADGLSPMSFMFLLAQVITDLPPTVNRLQLLAEIGTDVGTGPLTTGIALLSVTVLFEDGRFADAKPMVDKLLAENPDSPDVLHAMARYLMEHPDQLTEAARLSGRVLILTPSSYPFRPVFLHTHGLIQARMGFLNQANKAFVESLTLADQPTVRRDLARLLMQQRNWAAAERQIQQALAQARPSKQHDLVAELERMLTELPRRGDTDADTKQGNQETETDEPL